MPAVKALIVDDSKVARISLFRLLKEFDVEADMAGSGREAIDYLKSGSQLPDIVFMDHTMPEMDGFETVRHIKDDPGIAGVPVIMCTANEGDQYEKEASEVGANGILSKPPVPERLQELLHALKSRQPAPEAPPAVEQEITMEQITTIAKSAAEESAREAVAARLDSALDERVEALLDKLLDGRVAGVVGTELGAMEARLSDLASSMMSDEAAQIREEIAGAREGVATELRGELASAGEAAARELLASELDNRVDALLSERIESVQEKMIAEARQGTDAQIAAKMDELQQLLDEKGTEKSEAPVFDQDALQAQIERGVIERVESLLGERADAIQKASSDAAKSDAESTARGLLEAELNQRVEALLGGHVDAIRQQVSEEATSGAEVAVEKRLEEIQKHFDEETENAKEFTASELASLRQLIVTELDGRIEETIADRLKAVEQKAVDAARASGEAAFTQQLNAFRESFEKQSPDVLEKLVPEASAMFHLEKKINFTRLLAFAAGTVGILAAVAVYFAP